MKIYRGYAPDPLASLRIEEAPAPGALGPGQIRIDMRAATLNYRDLLMLSAQFGVPGPEGMIPVCDGAGEVVEVAPDVRRFKPGDRIALTYDAGQWIGGPFRLPPGGGGSGRGSPSTPGVMRQQIVAHNSEGVMLPAHLTYEEGAAYPCAGVTAWHSLCGEAPLLPGMTVLLQGAGGVSVLALQFAKLFGSRVIITSSSDERCARLKSMGADETINYRADPDWHKTVRRLTDGQGVDLTVEVGGADTIERSLASTRPGGRIALVGLLSGWAQGATSMQTASVDITPIRVGPRDDLENLFRALAFHRQRPVIDATYRFEQLPQALQQLKSGSHFGKIAISFN
jgi:NADPH:quinone reductase-like Zn-dependent oxidoreductase